mmetsp:Transcript_4955/g.5672  ORF Transcript_4955/g.5672 Transcript_4955/m.5672 type:complete len:246 (-) Transcript_4955:3039-3776(-)
MNTASSFVAVESTAFEAVSLDLIVVAAAFAAVDSTFAVGSKLAAVAFVLASLDPSRGFGIEVGAAGNRNRKEDLLAVTFQGENLLAVPFQEECLFVVPFQEEKLLVIPFREEYLFVVPFQGENLLAVPFQDEDLLAVPYQEETLLAVPFQNEDLRLAVPFQDEILLAVPFHQVHVQSLYLHLLDWENPSHHFQNRLVFPIPLQVMAHVHGEQDNSCRPSFSSCVSWHLPLIHNAQTMEPTNPSLY